MEATKVGQSMSPASRRMASLQRATYRRHHQAENDAFSRARRSLVSRGLMDADNDFYMLSDKATSGVIHENVAGQKDAGRRDRHTPLGVSSCRLAIVNVIINRRIL